VVKSEGRKHIARDFHMFNRLRQRLEKGREKERKLERPIEAFSRVLWPFPESRLILFVSLMATLDYASTFLALELSGNPGISEMGLIAKGVLDNGGFPLLLLVDALFVAALVGLAFGIQYLYKRMGYSGFGRAAFVFLLVPYFAFTIVVVANNLVLAII
jgi:hypothetical protein